MIYCPFFMDIVEKNNIGKHLISPVFHAKKGLKPRFLYCYDNVKDKKIALR
jgi:hypothetical protein